MRMTIGELSRNVTVKIRTYDLANVVDANERARPGAWKRHVECKEQAVVPEKPVEPTATIAVVTDDLIEVVDARSFSEVRAGKVQ